MKLLSTLEEVSFFNVQPEPCPSCTVSMHVHRYLTVFSVIMIISVVC